LDQSAVPQNAQDLLPAGFSPPQAGHGFIVSLVTWDLGALFKSPRAQRVLAEELFSAPIPFSCSCWLIARVLRRRAKMIKTAVRIVMPMQINGRIAMPNKAFIFIS